MKNDLRVGVIGLGHRGWFVEFAHNPKQGVHVAAAADIDPKPLGRFQEIYGRDTFVTTDYRRLLERDDIGAVFIATPDHCHEEHAVAALEAGKAVYLEKPMAITIKGCDRILATARRTKSKLYVGHNMRHFPVIRKMKDLIDAGAIGEVKAAGAATSSPTAATRTSRDWHAERSKGTGLLLQKGTHDIDVLHWLCGAYTRRVTAMGGLTLYDRIKDRHRPRNTAMRRSAWRTGLRWRRSSSTR